MNHDEFSLSTDPENPTLLMMEERLAGMPPLTFTIPLVYDLGIILHSITDGITGVFYGEDYEHSYLDDDLKTM